MVRSTSLVALVFALTAAVMLGDPLTGKREVVGAGSVGRTPPAAAALRQGGDTCAEAVVIPGLPFEDWGTTCGYANNYDAVCPFSGSIAPDVVYAYTPSVDEVVTISLCNDGTDYNTKLYVYAATCPGPVVACNDDACNTPQYPPNHVSYLTEVELLAGRTYYIVVDGYGTACGSYHLTVEPDNECVLECPAGGVPEGEPDCHSGYEDEYNGGCGSIPAVFQPISCGQVMCARYGTFLFEGIEYRDTDWYEVALAEPTVLTWTLRGEAPTLGIIIHAVSGDCSDFEIIASGTGDACVEFSVQTSQTGVGPGLVWLWAATSGFSGVPCGADYVATLLCEPAQPPPTGDTCTVAFSVGSLPFTSTGNTCDFTHDYDEVCPYGNSHAPDVVYSYTPAENESVTIDLCVDGTNYDTKVYVYAGSCPGTVIGCSDDACSSPQFANFVSRLTDVPLEGGLTYYIVVDGYGSQCGNYTLEVWSEWGPHTDLWYTPYHEDDPDNSYQDFTAEYTIPAGFFGPGSEPFEGTVYFVGEPLDPETSDTDTVIERPFDPVQSWEPVGAIGLVPLEITQLSLRSAEPILVLHDGGLPGFWDVRVGLSPSTPAPMGQMTATKTHANGGTFNSTLYVQPLLTFTRVGGCGPGGDLDGDGDVDLDDYNGFFACFGLTGPAGECGEWDFVCSDLDHSGAANLADFAGFQNAFTGPGGGSGETVVLDTGTAGLPPLMLESFESPFVHEVNPDLGLYLSPGAQFVAGVEEVIPGDPESQQVVFVVEQGSRERHRVRPPKGKFCIYEVTCIDGSCQDCPLRDGDLCYDAACPGGTCTQLFSRECGDPECCLDYTNVACRPPEGEPPCPSGDWCECDPAEGACCDSSGGCSIRKESDCDDAGGQYLGDHSTCTPTGACCFTDLTHCIITRSECCDFAGGFFQGNGTTCGGYGACCFDNGLCEEAYERCCLDAGGTFHEGAGCDATAACCKPNGQCVTTTDFCCDDLNGEFLPGEACGTPDPCEKGACCYGNAVCVEEKEEECGGVYKGPGTRCAKYHPTITQQPQNTGVCALGDAATFTIAATSSEGTLHYQWKKNGVNVGTDNLTLMVNNVQAADHGAQITCEVTDDCGKVTSTAATLAVLTRTSQTEAETPANRDRTTLGIAERVTVSTNFGVVVTWSVSGGGIVSPVSGTSTVFTASRSPSVSRVKATFGTASCDIEYTVIAPTGMDSAVNANNGCGAAGPPNNTIGASTRFDCTVQPLTVSFYRAQFRENIPGEAYTWPDGTAGNRAPAIVPWSVNPANGTTDDVSQCGDGIGRLDEPPPGGGYVDFHIDVRVPEEYQDEGGNWVAWLPGENHPRDYRGADAAARVSIEATNTANGSWQGPWQ